MQLIGQDMVSAGLMSVKVVLMTVASLIVILHSSQQS